MFFVLRAHSALRATAQVVRASVGQRTRAAHVRVVRSCAVCACFGIAIPEKKKNFFLNSKNIFLCVRRSENQKIRYAAWILGVRNRVGAMPARADRDPRKVVKIEY